MEIKKQIFSIASKLLSKMDFFLTTSKNQTCPVLLLHWSTDINSRITNENICFLRSHVQVKTQSIKNQLEHREVSNLMIFCNGEKISAGPGALNQLIRFSKQKDQIPV